MRTQFGARGHTYTPTPTHTHTRARTHARTHAHTHIPRSAVSFAIVTSGHGVVAEAEESAIDEAKALLATKKLRAAMKTRELEELQSAIAIAESVRVVDAAVLDEAKDLVPELAGRMLLAESEDNPSYPETKRFTQLTTLFCLKHCRPGQTCRIQRPSVSPTKYNLFFAISVVSRAFQHSSETPHRTLQIGICLALNTFITARIKQCERKFLRNRSVCLSSKRQCISVISSANASVSEHSQLLTHNRPAFQPKPRVSK